jgi:hypothetical protein
MFATDAQIHGDWCAPMFRVGIHSEERVNDRGRRQFSANGHGAASEVKQWLHVASCNFLWWWWKD